MVPLSVRTIWIGSGQGRERRHAHHAVQPDITALKTQQINNADRTSHSHIYSSLKHN